MMKVICILVLYNPDENLLQKTIEAIINQTDAIWISDNSTNGYNIYKKIPQKSQIIYKKMSGNIGIAAAQNYGIKYAIEHHYDFLYFLDQDSISPNNIIKTLLNRYSFLLSKNINVGAIGPRPYNRKEKKEYKGLIKKGKRLYNDITEVNELINSASLISVNTFNKVGMMDEKLFIDGVDHEWCWRTKFKIGARFFIIESIKLSHQLGEGDRFFLFRKIAIPTAFRTYYQYRNYFILVRRNYVPLYWKVINAIKYTIKYFYYPLFISPHIEYFKRINKGIKDGICNNR